MIKMFTIENMGGYFEDHPKMELGEYVRQTRESRGLSRRDLATLKQMLGHSDIATTMRYLTALNSDDVITAHRKFSPGDKFL